MHSCNFTDIVIPENRQRREIAPEKITDLAGSISQNGLLHPPTMRIQDGEIILVAGECRLKALEYVWNFGEPVKCDGRLWPEGIVPYLTLGDLDPIDAFEAELEENIRRNDLTWQDKARAVAELMNHRKRQAARDGLAEPTLAAISKEIRPDDTPETAHNQTRAELIVSDHLHDPDVAKAKSASEAFKILKRKEELKRSAALGVEVGKTFSAASHSLQQGDCLALMKLYTKEVFDIILTDPPYGIGAQDYGDSGGKTPGAHFYEDSLESWEILMKAFCPEIYRIAMPQAHAYVFCDIDNFITLRTFMARAGWKVFRTPLVWVNPSGMRAPWPSNGPQRKWQLCLYAMKGDKPVTRLYSDVITATSDDNLNHHAQKPVALYEDLLKRSAVPGDRIIDPFCGSGTIFPACHSLKLFATGIELDPSAYGIAVKRLGDLK